MNYQIVFDIKAKKEFEQLNLADQRKVAKHIDQLVFNPRPHTKNFRPLKGHDLYRLRVGNLRIIYSVEDTRKIIIIEKMRKRSEKFYKRL